MRYGVIRGLGIIRRGTNHGQSSNGRFAASSQWRVRNQRHKMATSSRQWLHLIRDDFADLADFTTSANARRKSMVIGS